MLTYGRETRETPPLSTLSALNCKSVRKSAGRAQGREPLLTFTDSKMGNSIPLMECPLRIVVISRPNDPWLEELVHLPPEARIIATGDSLEALLANGGRLFTEGNVLFFAYGAAAQLGPIVQNMPFLDWIHCFFAGIDHIVCPELLDQSEVIATNARGIFSSSLAEYTMMAIAYFNKDLPRLLKNKNEKAYERFTIGEMRGKTVGIIGYGDIGRSVAVLAKAYGMRVVGMRKHPDLSSKDPLLDRVCGQQGVNSICAESDFLVVCAALTKETRHIIGKAQLAACKPGCVLINIGRGALIDEEALIVSLVQGPLIGAALDVFTTEPLPPDSPLWTLPNVLISPHNADMTADFRHKSVKLFTDLCKQYIEQGGAGNLSNQVDVSSGY